MSKRCPLFLLFALVLLVSCGKRASEPTAEAVAPGSGDSRSFASGEEGSGEIKLVKLDGEGFKDYRIEKGRFSAPAHRKYLADPMSFAALPDQGLQKGATAVVGSRVCLLYPSAKLGSGGDLASLPTGIPIPFGTLIPIEGEKVSDRDNAGKSGMFSFQDNWNWFYPTSYKGKKGLVFGSDLYGLGESNENNRVSARLYQTSGRYDAFYPVLGYRRLSKEIAFDLERGRIAFQAVKKGEYELSTYSGNNQPDDMIALYLKHRSWNARDEWSRKTPVFVTTDLAAHAQHLMFDRTLQYLEEAFFTRRLEALNDAFLADLEAREPAAGDYRETLDKALLYFQVAKALLELAPNVTETKSEYGPSTTTYEPKDEAAVLAAYPVEVREEIAKMDKAEGFADSSVFAFKDGTKAREDYSQYKPRGHYTKNGVLAAYFRAMTWFGRIHFLIAQSGQTPLPSENGQSSDSTALTLAMEPIALLITDVAKADEKLYASWGELFDPITALIGLSDDLSFKEVLPLWRDQKVGAAEFGSWAASKDKLLAFMKLAHDKLRPPAISGSSVWWAASEGSDRAPPMGWRLFGQRFTYDSAIHQQLSPPRLMSRDMVRGLDVMKAFGSRTADLMLQQTDYPKMAGLKERLDLLEKEFDSYDAAFWGKTYYNSVLYQVKAQARFEPGTGFYFTETPAWGRKAMLSAHGTWAELRHDTLLYSKQNYAERAGDGDFEPTFRTEEIPDPVPYLEPNLPFWQGSALAVQGLLKTLDAYALLDEESADGFGRLRELYAKAAEIAEAETRDASISKKDLEWIATIPAELATMVLLHTGTGGSIDDVDQLRMGLVADVYTNAEQGLVLETAVGIPYRIYVALNDGQGGKRIAVGYSFSYYEFPRPMAERMTDEEWKKIAYDPEAKLDEYEPSWSKGIALPAEAASPGGDN